MTALIKMVCSNAVVYAIAQDRPEIIVFGCFNRVQFYYIIANCLTIVIILVVFCAVPFFLRVVIDRIDNNSFSFKNIFLVSAVSLQRVEVDFFFGMHQLNADGSFGSGKAFNILLAVINKIRE